MAKSLPLTQLLSGFWGTLIAVFQEIIILLMKRGPPHADAAF
jgi:hypothetical protein